MILKHQRPYLFIHLGKDNDSNYLLTTVIIKTVINNSIIIKTMIVNKIINIA